MGFVRIFRVFMCVFVMRVLFLFRISMVVRRWSSFIIRRSVI